MTDGEGNNQLTLHRFFFSPFPLISFSLSIFFCATTQCDLAVLSYWVLGVMTFESLRWKEGNGVGKIENNNQEQAMYVHV